jgi:hypothetical protein
MPNDLEHFVSKLVISTAPKKKNIRNNKESNPTKALLYRKKFQKQMIKKDFVSNMKLLSCNHSVMKTLLVFSLLILAFS